MCRGLAEETEHLSLLPADRRYWRFNLTNLNLNICQIFVKLVESRAKYFHYKDLNITSGERHYFCVTGGTRSQKMARMDHRERS